jgi:hypothetical protein
MRARVSGGVPKTPGGPRISPADPYNLRQLPHIRDFQADDIILNGYLGVPRPLWPFLTGKVPDCVNLSQLALH